MLRDNLHAESGSRYALVLLLLRISREFENEWIERFFVVQDCRLITLRGNSKMEFRTLDDFRSFQSEPVVTFLFRGP